jgi:lysophospholipase L1-like esterase
VPYPRADPKDTSRLPLDTWTTAQLPVTVRLEWVGDAAAVDVAYRTATDDLGYRGKGAGTTFALWRDGACVDEQPAVLGEGTVRLRCHGDADTRAVVYLPEGMKPTVLDVTPADRAIEPAPPQPRWLAYGDSVAEGWIASGPSGAWPAIAGRDHGLDVHNLGYAGSARGETASAEQVAALSGDVISVTHGTNCWTRVPFSAATMEAQTVTFLQIIRQGHPETPVVVATPVVRPDAEETPNRLGATLVDLRRAMELAVAAQVAAGDERMWLVPGRHLLAADLLGDGVHPGDEGHRMLAATIGAKVAAVLKEG